MSRGIYADLTDEELYALYERTRREDPYLNYEVNEPDMEFNRRLKDILEEMEYRESRRKSNRYHTGCGHHQGLRSNNYATRQTRNSNGVNIL